MLARTVWLVLAFGVCATWEPAAGQPAGTQPVTAPGAQPATTQPALEPIRPPDSADEIPALLERVEAEMRSLAPVSQAATTQPEALTKPASELFGILSNYRRELAELGRAYEERDRLKNEQFIQTIIAQVDQLKQDAQAMCERLANPPEYASAEQVDEAKKLYEDQNALFDAEAVKQTQRVQAAADYAKSQEERAKAIRDARQALETSGGRLEDRREKAESDVERGQIDLEHRRLYWLHNLEMLRSAKESAANAVNTLRQQHQGRILEAWQPYVTLLGDWKVKLEEAHGRGVDAEIGQHLKQAQDTGKAYEITFWLARQQMRSAWKTFQAYETRTRARFKHSEFQNLLKRIARDEQYWAAFLRSLPRRRGADIRDKYNEIVERIDEVEELLAELQAELDESIDERQRAEKSGEQTLANLDELQQRLRSQIDALSDNQQKAKAEKKLAELTATHRTELEKKIQTIIDSQNAVIDRLTNAIESGERPGEPTNQGAAVSRPSVYEPSREGALVTAEHVDLTTHLEHLEEWRSDLYWSYLLVRDQGLLAADWQKIGAELGQLRDGQRIRSAFGSLWGEAVNQVSGLGWHHGVVLALLIGASVALARRASVSLGGRAHAAEAKVRQAQEEAGLADVPLSDRLELHTYRFVSQTARLTWPLIAAIAWLWWTGMQGPVARLACVVLCLLVAARLVLALIRELFTPAKPRFRLIRCSNVVASYYRRWSRRLVWLTVVALPALLALWAAGAVPATRAYLWQVYKAAALVLLLVFLARKQLVLKVVGRPDQLHFRRLYSVIVALYPAIFVAVILLLICQVIGYGALTEYAVIGVAKTIATFALAVLLVRYVNDLSARYVRRVRERTEHTQEQTDEQPPPTEHGDGEFLVSLAATIFRWTMGIAAAILILTFWGISPVEVRGFLRLELGKVGGELVTLWRVGAAVIAIIVAVVVSRSLRTVLDAKVYPEYSHIDRGAQAAINSMLHYFVLLVGIYAAMQLLHISLGALTIMLGTLGLGLGLGLQPLFINFISGLMILFERHMKVGDIVEVGDQVGEVTRISMRSTSIRTFDNIDMVIPNSQFITDRVVNRTLQDKLIRGRVNVGVAYGTDVQLVKRLLLKVAEEHPLVLREPPPDVWFTDFGNSSLDFTLVAWFASSGDRWTGMIELRYAIDEAFREHDITIPFPQRTLSLIGDKPLPIELVEPRDRITNEAVQSKKAASITQHGPRDPNLSR